MYIRLLLVLMLWCSNTAFARDIAGVALPESVVLDTPPALVLNGAGIRTKFFFKIYVGALYLPVRTQDVAAVLHHTGPVAIHMHFLHSEVSKQKLVDAWNDGFNANLNTEERNRLNDRIKRFNELFETTRKGDVIRLDYQPSIGTRVSINLTVRGIIEGEDFMQALLKIWLGPNPVDSDLKQAMLGTT